MGKENKQQEVKLTNQSFRDAGGLEVFPDLEMVEIVATDTNIRDNFFRVRVEHANEMLRKRAEALGCTHVFGIKYLLISSEKYGHHYDVIGTAYKPR